MSALEQKGRTVLGVFAVAVGTLLSAPTAQAFDCSKAYLAVDHVICSDPALIAAVDHLQITWNAIRSRLNETTRKTIIVEQRQWITDYADRCGVPGREKPDAKAIKRAQLCVSEELGQRQVYLASLSTPTPAEPSYATLLTAPSVPTATPAKGEDLEATYRFLFDPAQVITVDRGPEKLKIVGRPPKIPKITGEGWRIYLSGPIDGEADQFFSTFMTTNRVPEGSSVNLHSPGGSVRAGLTLGREFRKRGLEIHVAREKPGHFASSPGTCFSACSLAYLGGRFRFLDQAAQYGVHRFSFTRTTSADVDVAQILAGKLIDYFKEMGIEAELFSLMSQAGTDDMLVLPKSELERLNVVNNGILSPAWSIESVEGGIYVKGQQETVHGAAKALFLCNEDKQIVFKPMFSGDVPPELMGGASPRKLMLDDDVIDLAPYEVELVRRERSYITSEYLLPQNVISALLKVKRLGYAVLASNPDFFYGYQMDFTGGRQKLSGFVSSCR